MAKVELKGTIKAVSKVEEVGNNKMLKQTMILFVPGYVDGFGDKTGKDEEWSLEILGDNVKNLELNETFIDMRVKCTVFVESKLITLPTTHARAGETFHQISAKLWKTEFKA